MWPRSAYEGHVSDTHLVENAGDLLSRYPSPVHRLWKVVQENPTKIVAMYPNQSGTDYIPITAEELWDLGGRVALWLSETMLRDFEPNTFVALLTDDNPLMFLIVLGLLKADFHVLLIAHKQAWIAVDHLTRVVNATAILTTDHFADTTFLNKDLGSKRLVLFRPFTLETLRKWPISDRFKQCRPPRPNELEEKRFCLHSSGSTQLPHPILFSNRRVLVDQLHNESPETQRRLLICPYAHTLGFTEGIMAGYILGVTNVFLLNQRFPPALSVILKSMRQGQPTHVETVPAILENIALTIPPKSADWEVFRSLESVLYGGAPVPEKVAKAFLSEGVTLNSGYGSTETGINMKSVQGSCEVMEVLPNTSYRFVPQDTDDVDTATEFELVILKDSPICEANNCPEGFATEDIFIRGPEVGQWIHRGRKGDTLVHINGEKTNARALEHDLINHCNIVRHCCVVGAGRHLCGLLVEVDWTKLPAGVEAVSAALPGLAEALKGVNARAPAHSRILRNMVYVLPQGARLPTSDKGNVQRHRVYAQFAAEIDGLYSAIDHAGSALGHRPIPSDLSLEAITRKVLGHCSEITNTDVSALRLQTQTAFIDLGIDSLAVREFADRISTDLGIDIAPEIIYQKSNLGELCDFLFTTCQHTSHDSRPKLTENELIQLVANLIDVSPEELHEKRSTSLSEFGLSSLEAQELQREIENKVGRPLGPTFTFDHPSVAEMMATLFEHAATDSPQERWRRQLEAVTDLSEKFGVKVRALSKCQGKWKNPVKHVIMIVGASGGLGAQICRVLMDSDKVVKLYCILRGDDPTQRMRDELKKRGLDTKLTDKVECLNFHPRDEFFGIGKTKFDEVKKSVTDVILNAWKVDFNLRVQDFESDWFSLTLRLLEFCTNGPKSFSFVSSISSVMGYAGGNSIPEHFFGRPEWCAPMGYGQSKFVAESMCQQAQDFLGLPVRVLRCGQLCGDSKSGAWKKDELVPLVTVKCAAERKFAPARLGFGDFIPIDTCGAVVADLVLSDYDPNQLVYHLANPVPSTWTDWLDLLQKLGFEFDRLDRKAFLSRLKQDPHNPCNLLYGPLATMLASSTTTKRLDTRETESKSPTLRACPKIDTKLAKRFFDYWCVSGFWKH